MKRLLVLCALLLALSMLSAQTEYWHTYYPGGTAAEDVYLQGSTVWVSSLAGLMKFNPETGERIQYNIHNGPFSSNSMLCLCGDQDLRLWVGVLDGARCFDGETWVSYNVDNSTLPTNTVDKIVEDTHGGIWFATSSGMARYRNDMWDAFTSANSPLPASYEVKDLKADLSGGIWLATDQGLFHYNGSSWESHIEAPGSMPFNHVTQIAFESNGTTWFTYNAGLLKYQNDLWNMVTELYGLGFSTHDRLYIDSQDRFWRLNQSSLRMLEETEWVLYHPNDFADYYYEDNHLCFRDLNFDASGNLWLTFFDTYSPLSLIRYDGINIDRFPICELPLPSTDVYEIFKGLDDKIWIGTANIGTTGGYISLDNGNVECFGIYNTDMFCDHVWALAQDSSMNMWIHTCTGLVRIGPGGSQYYYNEDTGLEADRYMSICAVGNGIWYGGDDGVSRYQDGSWSVLTAQEAGMSLEGCKVIKTDYQGKIWIGCTAGICCYDNNEFTCLTDFANVTDFAFGPRGDVWIAHSGQISYHDSGNWTNYNADNSGLSTNNIGTLAVDTNQVLWAGTSSYLGGLYRFDGSNWTYFDSSNSPLVDTTIYTLFADEDNTIWIGSKHLYCYNEGGLPSSVQSAVQVPPTQYGKIYPNPFCEQATIRYSKQSNAETQISIFNLKGQKVRSFSAQQGSKADLEIVWNGLDEKGRACASGVYLIRINEGNKSFVMKALRLK